MINNQANQRLTSDPLGRYYTRTALSTLLVSEIPDCPAPNLVLDLGAGDGSLIKQAYLKWENAKLITVDINSTARSSNLPNSFPHRIKHHTLDALDNKLAKKIGLAWGEADIALCNPPFIKPRWQSHFSDILYEAGFPTSNSIPVGITTDILFIAQNLRLLKTGGHLGLIVPDGLISGERHTSFRHNLIMCHHVVKVIELPRGIFNKTEAKAHILIVTKGLKSSSPIPIYKLLIDGNLSKPIWIEKKDAAMRMDYSYLAQKDPKPANLRIKDFIVSLKRGNISSNEIRNFKDKVFHTTSFAMKRKYTNVSFHCKNYSYNYKYAENGDILIPRVGRHLAGKIVIVKNGPVLISDCIFCLTPKPNYRDIIYQYLLGTEGVRLIESLSRGIGATYLTKQAILNIGLKCND